VKVRVNGVLWDEAGSLYDLDEKSRSYIVRTDDTGTSTVIFGDGINGARLPSGMENIQADYRIGIGSDGQAGANSIILSQNLPAGLSEVSNPEQSSGGADPESEENARIRLPLIGMTHERIVSMSDYENFVATFPGVGKAKAVKIWTGERMMIHITIAGPNGESISETSELCKELMKEINERRGLSQIVEFQTYRQLNFGIEANLYYDPRYKEKDMEEAVKNALIKAFSFKSREFGQNVTTADVVPVIQEVSGVTYAALKGLKLDGAIKTAKTLTAGMAKWNSEEKKTDSAEMLLIDKEKIILTMSDKG
jgi:predicted phage baseplate assembly protein